MTEADQPSTVPSWLSKDIQILAAFYKAILYTCLAVRQKSGMFGAHQQKPCANRCKLKRPLISAPCSSNNCTTAHSEQSSNGEMQCPQISSFPVLIDASSGHPI